MWQTLIVLTRELNDASLFLLLRNIWVRKLLYIMVNMIRKVQESTRKLRTANLNP